MTINDPVAFVNSLWDWGCLNGCFGNSKIRVTDADGEVERHGYFLRIETKGDGVCIPDGQELLFDALLNTGVFTVVIVWGKPQDPHKIEVRTRNGKPYHIFENTSLDKLRWVIGKWYQWAENQTPAPRFSEPDSTEGTG